MKKLLSLLIATAAITAYSQDEEFLIQELNLHKGAVTAIGFNKSGKILASGGEDKTVQFVNIADWSTIGEIKDLYFPVKDICFFGDDQLFITAGSDIRLINFSNETLAIYTGNATHFWSIDFAPERNKITGGSYDEKIRVWDVTSQEVNLVLDGHEKSTLGVCFSPDEKYIVTGSRDKTVKVWNAKTGELMQNLERHSDNIFDVEFHPNGKYFASASKDKTVRIWDIETGKVVKTFAGNNSTIIDIEFSPDGYFLYTASFDGIVTVYELESGKKLHTYVSHTGAVNKVIPSPNGNIVATCGQDGKIFIWESAKAIAVNSYFKDELSNKVSSNPIFETKRKGETKNEYEIRKQKAYEEKEQIINLLFKSYKQTHKYGNISHTP